MPNLIITFNVHGETIHEFWIGSCHRRRWQERAKERNSEWKIPKRWTDVESWRRQQRQWLRQNRHLCCFSRHSCHWRWRARSSDHTVSTKSLICLCLGLFYFRLANVSHCCHCTRQFVASDTIFAFMNVSMSNQQSENKVLAPDVVMRYERTMTNYWNFRIDCISYL